MNNLFYKWIILIKILFLIVILVSSCRFIRDLRYNENNTKYVESCREKWRFVDLKDSISIKLLLHYQKGRYDLMSWPNLFIGVTNFNDTIGIIDDFSMKKYKKNMTLNFVPYDYSNYQAKQSWLTPVFTTHRNNKKNKLYCSIDTLFYGKLIEN